MDCIEKKSGANHVELLTQADKIERLQKMMPKHRTKSDVFLPDDDFYITVDGPEDLEYMADRIFRWLGIKHRSVTFHIDPEQEATLVFNHEKKTSSITLGWHCQENSFLAGAAIAHGISHHLLIARSKITLGNTDDDEELADLGTIHGGLGVLILNSFSTKTPVLGILAPGNYLSECLDYFQAHRIVDSVWQPYVLQEVMTNFVHAITSGKSVPYVTKHKKELATKKTKLLIVLLSVIVITGVSLFYFVSRPRPLAQDLQTQKDSIAILKQQVKHCEETVSRKQQTWDTSDIFIQRQIEADGTRCASLRSRYNYEVNDYNSKL